MKRYRLRLALANALIVVSAATLAALLLSWIAQDNAAPARWLFPALAALVSCGALAFAIVESIAVCRRWKEAAAEKDASALPPEI